MKHKFFKPFTLVIIAVLTITSIYALKNPDSNMITVERLDPALNELIAQDPKIEVIGSGYEWSEGPVWIEKEQMLLFSDIPNNSIFKWTKEKGAELYLKPSGYTSNVSRDGETGSNGLLLNKNGQLVLCQHGDRRMAVMDAPVNSPKPNFITLADKYDGKKFNSPNDAAYHPNGDLYFTDPPYGLEKNMDDPLKETPFQGVYKVSPQGKVTLLVDSITRPNGIAFLNGGKSIIIANSDSKNIFWYIYDVSKDGLLANGRIFHDATEASKTEKGAPDGLKMDKKGNVYSTGPGGIWIFNSAGKVLGKIKVDSAVSNCCFADDDKTLFVTADDKVLKISLR